MSIDTALTSIVDGIRAALPDLKTCESHDGRFDLNELKRISTQVPAIYVAALATGSLQSDTGTEVPVTFAAYVITRDQPKSPRDRQARLLVDALLALLNGNTWNDDNIIEAPMRVRSQNLYSAGSDRSGVAMWAVTFTHQVRINEFDASTLDDFLTFAGTSTDGEENTLIETTGTLEAVNAQTQS